MVQRGGKQKVIGILGIGQAGGNIAAEFAKLRYQTGVINTSEMDLDSIKGLVQARLLLKGPDGAAKDPGLGYQAVVDNVDAIVQFQRHMVSPDLGLKALGIVYSLGGGTGAGAGPSITELAVEALPGIQVFSIVVMPSNEESAVTSANSVESFAFASKVEHMGATFIIDNQQALSLFRAERTEAGRKELFSATNGIIARLIHELNQVVDMSSPWGNFDRQELLALLGTRGGMVIGEAYLPDGGPSSAVDIGTLARISWERSIFSETEYRATRAAVIWQAPAEWTKRLTLQSIFDPVPGEVHEGIYEDDRRRMLTVLAGLPWPVRRLREIEMQVETSRQTVAEATMASQTQVFETTLRPLYERPALGSTAAGPREIRVADILERQRRRR